MHCTIKRKLKTKQTKKLRFIRKKYEGKQAMKIQIHRKNGTQCIVT